MITPEHFMLRFPEFKSTDLPTVGFFMDEAKVQISEKAWGKLYVHGVLYLTAHLLFLSLQKGGLTGQVLSKKAGELQVNYAQVSSTDNPFAQSSYGLEYQRLKRLIAKPIGLTR